MVRPTRRARGPTTTLPRSPRRKRLSIAALLADNNAYELHKRLGTLIRTGPTDTNVGDLQVALIY